MTAAASCIDNVPCSATDSGYVYWRAGFGMIEASRYLCRSDHRESKSHTVFLSLSFTS